MKIACRYEHPGPVGRRHRGVHAGGPATFWSQQSRRSCCSRSAGRFARSRRFGPIDKSALQDSFGGNQAGAERRFPGGTRPVLPHRAAQVVPGLHVGTLPDALGLQPSRAVRGRRGRLARRRHLGQPLEHPPVATQMAGASAGRVWAMRPGNQDPLDTVQLGVCTGSVACAAALKIQLHVFEQTRGQESGADHCRAGRQLSRHATCCRSSCAGCGPAWRHASKWSRCSRTTPRSLEKTFRKYGSRVAGFWAEPVMMNREAIAVEPRLSAAGPALLPRSGRADVPGRNPDRFLAARGLRVSRRLGLQPDLVVLGKGMTAGFHPLSGVLCATGTMCSNSTTRSARTGRPRCRRSWPCARSS